MELNALIILKKFHFEENMHTFEKNKQYPLDIAFRVDMHTVAKSKQYPLDIAFSLSLQRALLCEIFPNFRMIAFEYNNEQKTLYIFFYIDKEISNAHKAAINSIAAEVNGDFTEYEVIEKCIRSDFPEKLPLHTYTIYRRNEEVFHS